MNKKLTKKIPKNIYKRKGVNKTVNFTKFSLKILKLLLSFTAISFTLIAFTVIYYAHDLPDLKQVGRSKNSRKIIIVSSENEIIAEYGNAHGHYISYNQLPQNLINAVISTEDKRFFNHPGIDFIGITRAFYQNIKAKRIIQGGSTITQQLAKIIYLTPERNFKRKIKEFIIALYLESKFSKQKILEIYLNRVYLGSGLYGIDAATRYYFGKQVKQLSLKEAAIIAAILKAPTYYSPTGNIDKAGKRAFQVLTNMANQNYISQDELDESLDEPVYLETSHTDNLENSYVARWILEQVNAMLPGGEDDLIVHTTVSIDMQYNAKQTLNQYITNNVIKQQVGQGALLAMSPNGAIRAMVGGLDFIKSPFNRAINAYRQPGSAFKHIVYTAAFANGLTPDDIEVDQPIKIGKWQPRNITRKYYGPMTLREAFGRSINTIAIEITERIGREQVVAMAKKMGINSKITSVPSITLGTAEVNLLELTSSYSVIANDGFRVPPYCITQINNKHDKILYKHQNNNYKVIDYQTVAYIKDVLSYTINSGSARNAKIEGLNLYAKTGTSQSNRDGWFIGFADDIVVGVWLGNDDDTPTKVVGSGLPAQIWRQFMIKSLDTDVKK